MDVLQASKKLGVSVSTVHTWCMNGMIPGAVKNGRRWVVPDDAQRPMIGRSAHPLKKPKQGELSPEDIAQHILRYASTQTYEQLKLALGIPTHEIRRIYDELHDAYGI